MAGIRAFVYVGDYGTSRVTDETLKAYGVEFLKDTSQTWRRSSKKRADAQRFIRDIEAVQRYAFKAAKELDPL